jgi:Family of unknown function (DUF5677)
MSDEESIEEIRQFLSKYVEGIRAELHERWKLWPLDLTKKEVHEVVGALLAREVSLATNLALAPVIWNGHVAPLILRSMVDAYITLAWIFVEPVDRSRKYILYGLGQEKLEIEHRKKLMDDEGRSYDDDPSISAREKWLNSQRFTFLTEVNVGSWSGADARTMATEAACLSLYHYAYVPFSASTHNMWHHLSRYNLVKCPNPLHAYHRIPLNLSIPPDIDYVYRAAKYVDKAFRLFDEKTGVKVGLPSGLDGLEQWLESFGKAQATKLKD